MSQLAPRPTPRGTEEQAATAVAMVSIGFDPKTTAAFVRRMPGKAESSAAPAMCPEGCGRPGTSTPCPVCGGRLCQKSRECAEKHGLRHLVGTFELTDEDAASEIGHIRAGTCSCGSGQKGTPCSQCVLAVCHQCIEAHYAKHLVECGSTEEEAEVAIAVATTQVEDKAVADALRRAKDVS